MTEIGRRAREAIEEIAQDERIQDFRIDTRDFPSARERGWSAGTRIEQREASLGDAAEIVNRSFPEVGEAGRFTNVISPV